MSAPSVTPRLVRTSESAIWFLFVGIILIVSAVVDVLDRTTVVGSGGSAVVMLVGLLLTGTGMCALWWSRAAWAYPASVPRAA